ncbi:MAG: hypothetical protein IKI57_04580 [Clostridia bacterium]|nr:hypothetical protein [Clostridia bacterium]
MNKFFSLLRAVMSQDMELLKYRAKANASSLSKLLIPIMLGALIMFSIGSMFLPLAIEFQKTESTYIILSFSTILPVLLAFMEGIYKSQSILFEAKDTELLFSLPISKRLILLTRIIKLYSFQFLYSLLFFVPGIVVYALHEKTDAYFYVITVIMALLLPIIPTIIGCIIGFIVKKVSSKFKARKLVEIVLMVSLLSIIMLLSMNSKGTYESLITNSSNINNIIKTYYYPIGAYVDLIKEFDLLKFLTWVLVSAIPFVLFVLIAGKIYFGLVSKSKENIKKTAKQSGEYNNLRFKQNNKMIALIKKEFSRYFSSTVYVINTIFGLVLLTIATIALSLNFEGAINFMANDISREEISTLNVLAPKVYLVIVMAMSFMTSITSSAISIEGKTFNISKSLPVATEKLLFAKILMSNLITIPVIIICDIIFCISVNVGIIDIVAIAVTSFVAPSIAAIFGLLVNLKFPKMDASSDTEIVKQSMSSMISVFSGIILAVIFFVITFIIAGFGDVAILFEMALLCMLLLILWLILKRYGKKRYKEIEA